MPPAAPRTATLMGLVEVASPRAAVSVGRNARRADMGALMTCERAVCGAATCDVMIGYDAPCLARCGISWTHIRNCQNERSANHSMANFNIDYH
eukprot:6188406-Pleurochrysis_carterae.AAC.2